MVSLSDMRTDVRCWAGVLAALGHTVINYSQDGPHATVEVPLVQFEQRIVPFIRDEVLTGRLAGKRVIVLAHSRGGILVRAYLHNFPQDGQEWISQVLTICSPHQGTEAPRAKRRLANLLNAIPFTGSLLFLLLDRMMFLEETAANLQLVPENSLFDRLADPADVPAIRFRTFGGTSVRYTREYFWIYTPDSYIPNVFDFPDVRFDWTQFATEIPLVSTDARRRSRTLRWRTSRMTARATAQCRTSGHAFPERRTNRSRSTMPRRSGTSGCSPGSPPCSAHRCRLPARWYAVGSSRGCSCRRRW